MYNLQKLKTIFDQISYGTTEMNAFNEILDFSMLPYKWFDTAEELNDMFAYVRSHEKRFLITSFMTELVELNPEGFSDPLGEFYQCHITYGRMGQYFTPEPIADLISEITLKDELSKLSDDSKVLDPACGSGRFLLSAAKFNRNLNFYGADLDPVCCKMAVMNMIINTLTGEVANLNSLSNEFFVGYHVKAKLINGYYTPYYVEFSDQSDSFIHLKMPVPQKSDSPDLSQQKLRPIFIQGDLFK